MDNESLCNGCAFDNLDSNKYPCNSCLKWVEGYLEATKYENKQ
jgi:hypothetical protein